MLGSWRRWIMEDNYGEGRTAEQASPAPVGFYLPNRCGIVLGNNNLYADMIMLFDMLEPCKLLLF